MPIYEYQCDACESTFEAIQKFSDAPLDACRACGESGVRKLVSAPAFRLKGSGWYETDFKNNNQRNVAKSDSSSADSGGGSASDSGGGSDGSGGGSDSGKSTASGSSGSDSGGSTSGSSASSGSGASKSGPAKT